MNFTEYLDGLKVIIDNLGNVGITPDGMVVYKFNDVVKKAISDIAEASRKSLFYTGSVKTEGATASGLMFALLNILAETDMREDGMTFFDIAQLSIDYIPAIDSLLNTDKIYS